MKINKTYRALLDKSIDSMLSAIEIYNKPNFNYREETFAVLAVNAWELLLKAYILRENRYNIRSLYVLEPSKNKSGEPSKRRKVPKLNRSGNPKSLSIEACLKELESKKKLPEKLKSNIISILELRDNAIHFVNISSISKQIQELGFACIKNYITAIKLWKLDIDISRYNLYLMPLAYVDEKLTVNSVITSDSGNYVTFIQNLLKSNNSTDSDFDIAISIDIDFKKGNSFESVGVKYDPDGTAVHLTEEQILNKFPWNYKEVASRCRERYVNFKQDKVFNQYISEIKNDPKLCTHRALYMHNSKSPKTVYYNTNIIKFFDAKYTIKTEE